MDRRTFCKLVAAAVAVPTLPVGVVASRIKGQSCDYILIDEFSTMSSISIFEIIRQRRELMIDSFCIPSQLFTESKKHTTATCLRYMKESADARLRTI